MNRFNPHNRYNGIYVPDGIYQHEDLTPTTKLVYARLLRYSGKNGKAYPKQTTIAKELSVSVRTIQNSIKQLIEFQLIEVEKGNKMTHETDTYYFLESEFLGHAKIACPDTQKLQVARHAKISCEDTKKLRVVNKESHLEESQLTSSSPLPLENDILVASFNFTEEEEDVYHWLKETMNLCTDYKKLAQLSKKHGGYSVKVIYLKLKREIDRGLNVGIGALLSRLENSERLTKKDSSFTIKKIQSDKHHEKEYDKSKLVGNRSPEEQAKIDSILGSYLSNQGDDNDEKEV